MQQDHSPATAADLDAQVAELIALSAPRQRIVAFTGAGISTESGIPDYRGPQGTWKRSTPLTAQAFRDDPDVRAGYWQRRRTGYHIMADAQPNAGHLALARLEAAGTLMAVVTQNIDGLHQKAGNRPDRVIELHGTTHELYCLTCGTRYAGAEVQSWLEEHPGIPVCSVCGGDIRPATVLFGESLAPDVWQAAMAAVEAADLLLVVGSSLVVSPASSLPRLARQRGIPFVIINNEATPLDGQATLVIHAGAGPVLSALADALIPIAG